MDINQVMIENPAKIARKAEEAEEIRYHWQTAKEEYSNDEAKFVLTLKATKKDLKSTEIKYFINNDLVLFQRRLDLVRDESNYRKKEVEVTALEEELRAAKMLARIRISEITNLERSE